MFKHCLVVLVATSVLSLSGCGSLLDNTKPELGNFGIDMTAQDASVNPGDDFDQYASGSWYATYVLPDDKTRFGAFDSLRDRSEERIKAIIDSLATMDAAPGTPERLAADYFASFMDIDAINAKGIKPLGPTLDAIKSIKNVAQLTTAFGRARFENTASPIAGGLGINRLDPTQHQYAIYAGGLGLPDRDYYLSDTENFRSIRKDYVKHITQMLRFADVKNAAKKADAILSLETKIANHHWERAAKRDRDKTLNPMSLGKLKKEFAGFDWGRYFAATGYDVKSLNVAHPSAIKPIVAMIGTESLADWKSYLTYHTISGHAGLLSDEIYLANFEFYNKRLSGQLKPLDRWKRGVAAISKGNNAMGWAIGKIYVDRYFPEEAKVQMVDLVENLRAALGDRITHLDWMGDETKAKAHEKLEAFLPKIAYPDEWDKIDGLVIKPGDLFGNAKRARAYELNKDIAEQHDATDRYEWSMTPQTVNASYSSSYNHIQFPTGILQPPFFDMYADPAVNYGGIGAVIGHEMGHGFDDQGSKSDGAGVQRNWWTDEDRARFDAKASALAAQYDKYEVAPGVHVDGRFTLGENIGDVGGIAMAYHAYRISLNGQEAPVIDGLTGDQRFFLAWAQVWRKKTREQALLQQVKSDPHSPSMFRVNGVVRNHDAWYKAFNVKPGDKLYLAPEDRVRIW